MFDIKDSVLDKEKCYTSIGLLPPYIEPTQAPTKRSPFSAISGHPFIHSTELILPEEVYQTAWDAIARRIGVCQYAKVFMSLSDVIEGDFFNQYIKIGDILLISEGRSGVDNVYSLRNGILRLELDKSTYERAGLVGKSVRSGGKKHVASRYDAPIKKHHPQIFSCTPKISSLHNILTPPLTQSTFQTAQGDQASSLLRETCAATQEWLALVRLEAPRIRADDSIDPYLSRYTVPDREHCTSSNLVKLTWTGLIPSKWITQLFIATLRGTAHSTAWFAIASSALGKEAVEGKDGYMILALPQAAIDSADNDTPIEANAKKDRPQRTFVCWEYVGCPWSSS
ncbi:ribonuclease P subunit [Emydomyces testavorans]|uniref:Ribonuclease P subunit n=1 Tax=Emydomyces testavorans TaxID=2070801 RepID=A0AAF0DNP4_9EURO|nr:ribonuclease P subunit [Emydomyces testavorans]